MKLGLQHFWHLIQDFQRLKLPRAATQLAFGSLFAMVPLLALSIQIILWLPSVSDNVSVVLNLLIEQALPEGLKNWSLDIQEWLSSVRQLSLFGLIIYSSSSFFLLNAFVSVVNDIWESPIQKRQVFRLWLALIFIPVGIAMLVFFITLVQSAQWLPSVFDQPASWLADIKYLYVPLLFVLMLTGLYSLVPNQRVSLVKSVIVSSGITMAILLSSKLFFVVVSTLPSMKLMTGIISTLPLLMVWAYWISVLVLIGALLVRFWQLGPLRNLDQINSRQLMDVLWQVWRHGQCEKKDAIRFGIRPVIWDWLIEQLVEAEVVTKTTGHGIRKNDLGFQQSLTEIWHFISTHGQSKHQVYEAVFQPQLNAPLRELFEQHHLQLNEENKND